MNKKLAVLIIPVVILLISCIVALCFILPDGGTELCMKQINSAQKCVEMGDYEKAILYYKEAIKADETQETPYINLANLYYSLGDIDNAVSILRTGVAKSGTEKIKNALQIYLTLQTDNSETTVDNYSSVDSNRVDTTLVNILSTYTYSGYRSKYTVESEQYLNGIYTVKYVNLDATFIYSDKETKTIDETKSKPLDNARPTEIIVNDLEIIISGASNGLTVEDIENVFSVSVKNSYDKKLKLDFITFRYMNCDFQLVCDKNGIVKLKDSNNKIFFEPTVVEEIPTETKTIATANIDVVFTVDVSGSMFGNMNTAKDALNSFVDALDEKDRAGLVKFSDYATVLCGLTTDKSDIKSQVSSLYSGGLTSIHDGFSKSLDLLTDSSETYGYKMIVILSDGRDSYVSNGMSYDGLISEAVNNDVVVYTVGIGDNVDTALLTDISYRTGGEYYHAANSSQIINIFDEIQEEQIVVPANTSSNLLNNFSEDKPLMNVYGEKMKENELCSEILINPFAMLSEKAKCFCTRNA